MGDAQITSEEAMMNFDMAAFYANFLRDMGDAQSPDGALPGTVPQKYGDLPADLGWFVEDQVRIGKVPIAMAPVDGKAVEDFLRAGRGQLEHCTRAVRAAPFRGAVKVALLIEGQASIGTDPIARLAAKAVEDFLSAGRGQLEHRAEAVSAAVYGGV